MSRFHVNSRHLNTGPCACPTGTSLTDPPPEPREQHWCYNLGLCVALCISTGGVFFQRRMEEEFLARGNGGRRQEKELNEVWLQKEAVLCVTPQVIHPARRERNFRPTSVFGSQSSGDSNYPRAGLPERGRCGPPSSTCSKWVACPPGERLQGTWAGPRASAANRTKCCKRTDTLSHVAHINQVFYLKWKANCLFPQTAKEAPPGMGCHPQA